jgi:hypothetical protein
MDDLSAAFISFLTTVVSFFGQKETVGILVGALGTVAWYKLTTSAEQRRKNKQVIAALSADVEEIKRVAMLNVGVINNELSTLTEQKFTLDPLSEFNSTSADLLLLMAELRSKEAIELWRSMKKIESLGNQVSRLSLEAMKIRRAIKMEDRTHIYLFELIPFLKTYNGVCLNTLLRVIEECEKSSGLLKQIAK